MNLRRVNIEPTNICNLSCGYCGDRKKRQKGFMGTFSFKRIIEQLDPVEIRLFCSGEPFINPNTPKMAEIALEAGHSVLIHTNGFQLKREQADELYRLYKKYGRIHIVCTMHKEKVPDEIDYLLGMNFPVALQVIIPYPQPLKCPDYLKLYWNKCYMMLRYPHNWDKKDSVAYSQPEEFSPPCGFLLDSIAIYWNGDVPVCCADLNGDRIIGNVYKDGIPLIKERLDKIAQEQREGTCNICRGCERCVCPSQN